MTRQPHHAVSAPPASDAPPGPAPDSTDYELLLEWREQGRQAAATALYGRNFDRLYRFFRNKTGDPNDGGDLVSETFARLFHRRPQYPPILSRPNISPYLFGIANKVLLGYLRQRYRIDAQHDLASRSLVELLPRSPSSIVFACRKLYALTQALRTLPLRDQVLIESKYFEGMAEKELAELLGIPLTTVRGRVRDAHNHLEAAVRHHLTPWGGDPALTLDDLIAELRREMMRGAAPPE
jgi:RNA polymerase sigma factor (sigma-70 family)